MPRIKKRMINYALLKLEEKLFRRSFQVAVVVASILPVGASPKKAMLLKKVTEKFPLDTGDLGVKGMPPLGLPPPLGERGGHSHNIFKM